MNEWLEKREDAKARQEVVNMIRAVKAKLCAMENLRKDNWKRKLLAAKE